MKSISFSQKCFQALVLLALLATTAFAQPGGNHNPLPGGGPSKPSDSKDPDFDIVGFVIEGGTTVIRESMVNATISLKNKGGDIKKGEKVKLWYIPNLDAYKIDPSKNKIEVRDIEFNKDNEAVVHVEFAGYSEAKTFQSKAVVNPESAIAESSYSNNEQSTTVTVKPHKLEIDVMFTQVGILNDMDLGPGEFRMKMRAGTKKEPNGAVTWLKEVWFPMAPGTKVEDWIKVDGDKKDGPLYTINISIKLKDVSEEDYIAFETTAVDDDSYYISVTNQEFTDDENMGKCVGKFDQAKTWPEKLKVGVLNVLPTIHSDLNYYTIGVNAKIITKD